MEIPKRSRRHIAMGVTIFWAVMLLIDRYYWAQISQWREDQAANIWLGYTAKLGNVPVGLISSEAIPNPNGMLLLGFFLSALPNLLSVSFFLGVVQIVLLIFLGWKSFGENQQYFLLATIPSLSSVILRSISAEFWNQYTITLINIFFIFWALKYLEDSSLWNLPPIVTLILLAPSLYLAGIVNAIVMTVLTLGILAFRRPKLGDIKVILLIIFVLALLSIYLTWRPYFQNINLKQITGFNQTNLGFAGMFQAMGESFIGIPIYATFQWANPSTFVDAFKHADPQILSPTTQSLLGLVGKTYLLQAIFAFAAFIYMAFFAALKGRSAKNSKLNTPATRTVILSASFIGFSYTFSAWLGGPAWIKGERPDQTVQFLPMFLLLIFILPMLITTSSSAGKVIAKISYISLTIFATVNLVCGFMIIRDHLQYRGKALTEADVPLTDKMQVVNFIANDWHKHSQSNIVPVDYDLGGGKWDWVPAYGMQLLRWYLAPMTMGRSFDYELLRRYGLTNYQEGIQLRTFGKGRYLITYAFEGPPRVKEAHITNHIFGRLRVSIAER